MSWESTKLQRALTVDFITKQRLNAPVVWLKPAGSALALESDAALDPGALNTNILEWVDLTNDRNIGVRLVDGYIELKITAPDDVWAGCLFDACAHLRIDARASFGAHRITSILLKIAEPDTIDNWRTLWPKRFPDKAAKWVGTEFNYSLMPTPRAKPLWRDSSPLPGSRMFGELICWRPSGKPPVDDFMQGLDDLEPRPIATTNMESICRAIAFATLAYWIRVELDGLTDWDASLTRIIAGWTARLIAEGKNINARGKSLEGVCWSPIDSVETARELIEFLRAKVHASAELGAAMGAAERELERNPNAKLPGWPSLEAALGVHAKVAIRRTFRAGQDITIIETLSERYAFSRTAHVYLDREDLVRGLPFEHTLDAMVRVYQNEAFFPDNPKRKPVNPFQIYAGSSLRTDVEKHDFFPSQEPGTILRFSPVHGLLNGEDKQPDEYRILNTFPGFLIKPIQTPDPVLMSRAISMTDTMLRLLTRDNDGQMTWLKKNIAWTIQHPEIKQQVCPVLIGGQGIGKSRLGDSYLPALFGGMAGQADASVLTDNKFVITPFIGKLIVFIDEVRMESVGSINIIKKLARADRLTGQIKFGHQRDYYLPARLVLAANNPDIGLTPEDAVDRALFFIMGYTAENRKMTTKEFLGWSNSHKPFYNELVQALDSVVFRQHLMRYYMDLEVCREELEDLTLSSRDDENVVRSTMSRAREVARTIIASAHVIPGFDITAWFTVANVREAIKREDGSRSKVEAYEVMMEFDRAGVLETPRGHYRRFKYRYGTLIEKVSEAHGLKLDNHYEFKPDLDWGENDVLSPAAGPPWRGNKVQGRQEGWSNQFNSPRRDDYDMDYMEPQ
jgi:hypothetical protein